MNIKNKEVSMSKLQLSPNKVACLQKLSDENGIISALAFDQRGALKRLMAQYLSLIHI